MKNSCRRTSMLCLALIVLISALSGCSGTQPINGTAVNDILTFQSNAENKPIIHIGTQYYSPDDTLVQLLQEKYPEYLFVLDYAASAGTHSETRLTESLKNGTAYYDLVITGGVLGTSSVREHDLFVDLSAESFLNNYLLSSLNNLSMDGHVYMIPGTSTLTGIAFNADMFSAHGWEIPDTIDEFFALCKTIKSEGISPFSACFKYDGAVNRLITMTNYSELLKDDAGLQWHNDVQSGDAGFKGHFEPAYEFAKRLNDDGIISVDSFTASLTTQRQEFWAGKHAMIDYESTIYTYAEAEGAEFELGIMPYPSKNPGDAGFAVTPSYYFSIPKAVVKNPERLAFMKEILAFISTAEGQEALLADSLRISNVKNVALSENEATKYAQEAYDAGNLYPIVNYQIAPDLPFSTTIQSAVKLMFEGGTVDEAIDYTDAQIADARANKTEAVTYEKVATAQSDFTMLETSYYIADKFREATGADIGMMINGGFFRSNLASIDAGDISSDMSRFVLKGVGAEDFLTTFKLTGAQIKTLLEYPIVNDEDVDALIAGSGLKIEYAPWNERGSRVISVALEDGTALTDDAVYTVAAWAGAIDESYITETVEAHDTLGSFSDIMLKALTADKTIAPDIASRVTLVWPKAK